MTRRVCIVLYLLVAVHAVYGHYYQLSKSPKATGPSVKASAGQPWPKPQMQAHYGDSFVVVRPAVFRFDIVGNTCSMLEDAMKRYYNIILGSSPVKIQPPGVRRAGKNLKPWKNSTDFHGYLDSVSIYMMGSCENYPHEDMDESYEIKIDTPDLYGQGIITAASNWGILRGLETFSQMLLPTEDLTGMQIRNTLIVDYPRFPFRSILIDTARHFISKRVLLQNLDLMAMNKYNVFHWHIVDDQAFPYQSSSFPELSERGAYHPYTHVYTKDDMAEIIEYARVRGIRVVPEFDTPGHTESWGLGQSELLTPCYKNGHPDGTYGPIDPTKRENYEFLKTFFQEVSDFFPDKFIHLGGDEVDFKCWKSNPNISEFMLNQNFTQYEKLEEFYMQQLVNIVSSFPKNNSYLVWQEVVDNGVEVSPETIVHVWKGHDGYSDYKEELANVTAKGYRALLSSCWYLNYISYGIDWEKYYTCDPLSFNGTAAQKRLVLGGGPAMWAEYVDSTNLISRLWPRASVPAERLWSNAAVKDINQAASRLEEHRCRLLKRGFMVEPANGPGFCPIRWD